MAVEVFRHSWPNPAEEVLRGIPALWLVSNAASWTERSAEETKYPGHFGHTDDHQSFLTALVKKTEDMGALAANKATTACYEALQAAGLYEEPAPESAAQHAAHAAMALFDAAQAVGGSPGTDFSHVEPGVSVSFSSHTFNAALEPVPATAKIPPGTALDPEWIVRQIQSEYDMLLHASRREAWSNDTPVARAFFSPDSPIERQIAFVINDLCVELCKLIAKDERALEHIDWRLLEEVVAAVLGGLGFEVNLTRPSKDGGKDIIASCFIRGRKATYYVEIKHWRSAKRVGIEPVHYFVEVNIRDGTDAGLFLSTSGYAKAVLSQLAEITKRRVMLGSTPTVVSLCQHFVQERGRAVWQPRDVLPAVLFENTIEVGTP